MAAAMLFTGATVFAATPAKSVKQDTKKEASASTKKSTHKAHKKHAAKSTKATPAPKA